METIAKRLECFDEEGQKEAFKYLDKCLNRFFQSKLRKQSIVLDPLKYLAGYEDRLRKQGLSQRDIQHSKLCKMRVMGLISKEEERARIIALYGEGYLTS